MRPHGSCTRGPSKRFNEVNTINLHISSHVHDAVLLFCISPFKNCPTTNETIQKSSCLWQKLCSLLSKVCRWLLQPWKPWWWSKHCDIEIQSFLHHLLLTPSKFNGERHLKIIPQQKRKKHLPKLHCWGATAVSFRGGKYTLPAQDSTRRWNPKPSSISLPKSSRGSHSLRP